MYDISKYFSTLSELIPEFYYHAMYMT